jgi:hypothetical protein
MSDELTAEKITSPHTTRIREVFQTSWHALWNMLAQSMFNEWRKGDRKPLPMGGLYSDDPQSAWDADGRTRAEFYAFTTVVRNVLGDQFEGALSAIDKDTTSHAAALRARDERIAELEGVAKAFLKEHDDTYDGGPISSGQVAAVELARTTLEPRP